MAGTVFNYDFVTTQKVYETIEVTDSGNFCLEANNDSNIKYWLAVRTNGYAQTKVIKIIPTKTAGYKIELTKMDYDLNKIERVTRKFLESGATQRKEISWDEFENSYEEVIKEYFEE